jgi:ribonuclease P protein component
MIPFRNRFHGHNSLTYVYKNGQVVRSHFVALRYVANSHRKDTRLAVVIGKKILKSAVKRNRVRRRIYEYMRPKLSSLNGVYDIVFIVQNGEVLGMKSSELSVQIDQLIDQTNLKKPAKVIQKSQ